MPLGASVLLSLWKKGKLAMTPSEMVGEMPVPT
jgi:hypothetical protein